MSCRLLRGSGAYVGPGRGPSATSAASRAPATRAKRYRRRIAARNEEAPPDRIRGSLDGRLDRRVGRGSACVVESVELPPSVDAGVLELLGRLASARLWKSSPACWSACAASCRACSSPDSAASLTSLSFAEKSSSAASALIVAPPGPPAAGFRALKSSIAPWICVLGLVDEVAELLRVLRVRDLRCRAAGSSCRTRRRTAAPAARTRRCVERLRAGCRRVLSVLSLAAAAGDRDQPDEGEDESAEF